ncbi:MAG: class I SAM-dependent rRNA methyltransferase [Bdellovibrio sp.]|nr:class I SAM-dependent rRNA methyltransferase [Bdellovibrio sp.]
MKELETAWRWREERGFLSSQQALRVFHGPGEGSGGTLGNIAIDLFQAPVGATAWITQWENQRGMSGYRPDTLEKVIQFLKGKGVSSAVGLVRPQKGLPENPHTYFGSPPDQLIIQEGPARFLIRLKGSRHPGLFLDHQPLRQWLNDHAKGLSVLNTFAYTGSLSVAAALGGAKSVTTLDLSKPTLEWANENSALNGVESCCRTIFGDVFEWLPRLGREKGPESFDCIILDPPSFSRGKKGNFSTAKDLGKLHQLALGLIRKNGFLITSINSAGIGWKKYEDEILRGSDQKKMLTVLKRIDLPETFPTLLGDDSSRYLKGWILRVNSKD